MKLIFRYRTICQGIMFGLVFGLFVSLTSPVLALQDEEAPPPPPPPETDTDTDTTLEPTSPAPQGIPSYRFTGFEFSYVKPLSGLPDPQSFLDETVELSKVIDGWVGPEREGERMTVVLGQLAQDGPVTLYPSAIRAICGAITAAHEDLGFFVAPSEQDIDPETDADLRAEGRTTLHLRVAFEGPFYEISQFVPHYAIGDWPSQVPPSQILTEVSIMLTRTNQGYVTWRPRVPAKAFLLSELDGVGTRRFSAMAVQLILEGIRDYLTGEEYMGVWARPAPGELQGDLADARQGRTEFHIEIITGFVSNLRTIGRGKRLTDEDTINNPLHNRIIRNSPMQPSSLEDLSPTSILRRDVLDDYIYLLSRHPGRRVDVAIAPGIDPYSVTLDFHITENRPKLLYMQASNTGTKETDEWRYRFGYFDNQFSNRDDILNIEFVTADFDDNNSVSASYDAKFDVNDEKLRWRVYGGWSEYQASEVGFANERFTGNSSTIGGEIVWNFHQKKQLFYDLVVGARFMTVEVDNPIALVSGQEEFIIPYIGLRSQYHTVEAQTNALLNFEFNPNFTGTDQSDLNTLGRLFPDEDWYLLRWDFQHTFFLEPVLNREAWKDVSSPSSSTLAHEIALRFRGQYAFDHRMIPQLENVVGGAYSVRGYPESIVVGDTALIATAEYRFHIPRAFGFSDQPIELFNEPFRVVPQHPYGAADWDLIFRGFFDIGRTINSDRLSFEEDETLMGAGIGLEFAFKTNLNVKVDWGFALEELEGRVRSGSSQVHIVASIFF